LEYLVFQLQVGLTNVCLAPVINPGNVSALSIIIVIGVYTGIRLYYVIPFPMFAIFVALALDGVLAINFLLKECGKINKKSEQLLETFKIKLTSIKGDRKLMSLKRKEIESLSKLKIKMGSTNFFEMTTPLEVLHLCLDNVVNLLLAS